MEQVAIYITLFLRLLPTLWGIGQEALPIIEKAYQIWKGDTPLTQADWDALRAYEAKNSAIIQAPIPED